MMNLNIVMLDGTSHNMSVDHQDTVGSLKTRIQQKLGVAYETQKLVFTNGNSTPLNDDSKPISHYGLGPGARVSLLVTQPETIQVFLRNEKGKLTTYDIKPSETVGHFKRRVKAREGVPENQQRLIHQSREMSQDQSKLSDYGVQATSTIDLSLRLRGG
ncbi:polyubiquitin-B [Pungitius pungitius]|uniref:ubiquitin-like protein ISG15 n=1 Tax=Pungitius pungitius TaxID=134920 RepID=UPI0018879249|nr:ubiquitin-like protein ISG15 [Pungitius pungitius]XP_037339020.1 polyubiquitin-B [Pungitius pungitius]